MNLIKKIKKGKIVGLHYEVDDLMTYGMDYVVIVRKVYKDDLLRFKGEILEYNEEMSGSLKGYKKPENKIGKELMFFDFDKINFVIDKDKYIVEKIL